MSGTGLEKAETTALAGDAPNAAFLPLPGTLPEQPSSKKEGTLLEARGALQKDAEKFFKEISGEVGELDLEGLRDVVAKAQMTISDAELKQLFSELDSDGNGSISLEEFLSGLSAKPSVALRDALVSMLQSPALGLVQTIATGMEELLKVRVLQARGAQHDIQTMLTMLSGEDFRQAVLDSVGPLEEAFVAELENIQGGKETVQALSNNKFAAQTFEATYKDLADYRLGVEGALGMPGKDIAGGMTMEFCSSEDSKDKFTTSNYGGTTTTPEEEFKFVVNREMGGGEFNGGRISTPLQVFLYACCAFKAGSSDRAYDAPLAELDEQTLDGVKVVLLRRVKEAGLNMPFLAHAAEHDPRLERVAAVPLETLRSWQKKVDIALKAGARHAATGQPRFEEVASAVQHACGLSSEELDALLERMRASLREAGLREEEVLALRLYTGPLFVKLNGTLREQDVGGKGNNYVCSIFAAISGMSKLARGSPIPEGRVVFRGQQGIRLPVCFWKGNAQGVKGGVECAFLSTTTDVEVASGYAARGVLPTVFAIQVGAVDKGAALGWLSQYPDENEILMPPHSFLEVVGDPVVLATDKGPVVQIPTKINCNPCPELERLEESRKTMVVSSLEQIRKEVNRDIDAVLQTEEAKKRISTDPLWSYGKESGAGAAGGRFIALIKQYGNQTGGGRFIASIKEEIATVLATAKARSAEWYNDDRNNRQGNQEAMDAQRMAMGKLRLWMEDHTLYVKHLDGLSALDCDRKAAGRWRRLLEEAQTAEPRAGEEEEEGVARSRRRRGAALQLCKHLELVSEHVDEWRATGSREETALMQQSAAGNEEAVRVLLAAGADVEATRDDGMTAVILAARGGLTGTVIKLVKEGGANVDAQDRVEGSTALMWAAENGHAATVTTLLKECGANAMVIRSNGNTVTERAAYFGHLRVLEAMHQEGAADVHTANHRGYTPLMVAALCGHEETVKWLVEKGADVQAAASDGYTALMEAALNGHAGTVAWLVEKGGADVHAANKNGWTALMKAAQKGHAWVVKWLVEKGKADVHSVDHAGHTALMWAALNGHAEVVAWLAEEGGADVNAANNAGATALMLAAQKGLTEMVTQLEAMEARGGVEMNASDSQ